MNVTKGLRFKIAFRLLVVFSLGVAFFYLTPQGKFYRVLMLHVLQDRQKKIHLLSETDHEALLEACREISDMNLPPSRYLIRPESVPDVSLFPQIILDLKPMFIQTSSDGCVDVGLQGGWHHYGVIAYPEHYKPPSEHFKYGDKKIIDGLWYYEDGYNSRLDKWVNKHIQKRAKGGMLSFFPPYLFRCRIK